MNRAEVINYIETKLPEDATLEKVIKALCQLKLDTTDEHDKERLIELSEELELEQLVRGEHLPAVPTREEVRALMEAPDNDRDKLILRTFYATGMRVGEMAELKFADIRHDEQRIHVRSGKGDLDRYVLADPRTMQLLAAHRGERALADNVFLSVRRLHQIVADAAEKTGLLAKYHAIDRFLSPHSLRHAYATHTYENGMDLFTLKKLLGHAYLDTTEIYIATSVRRWLPLYMQCHELAKGE